LRPVDRGTAPRTYNAYGDAIDDLRGRLGPYCSYCERRIPVSLAVEHISPKKLDPALRNSWDNFLLACANCNSAKGEKPTQGIECLWPDRDNTLSALSYTDGGFVSLHPALDPNLHNHAQNLLGLVELQRHGAIPGNTPARGDRRWLDREQTFSLALKCKQDFDSLELTARPAYQELLLQAALAWGFFSCWLTVFQDHAEICTRLIAAMSGTAVDSFDGDGRPTPRPGGRC
jgi:hypothetical protein